MSETLMTSARGAEADRRARHQVEVALMAAQAEVAALRRALEWMVNVACGVGKAGTAPGAEEWMDAIEAGKDALAAVPAAPATQEGIATTSTQPSSISVDGNPESVDSLMSSLAPPTDPFENCSHPICVRARELRARELRDIEQAVITEAMEAALQGEPVSDFMLSFPAVRRAVDLQAEVATLRRELGQQVCRVCETPIGYMPHLDSCSFCQSARAAVHDGP